MKELRKFRRVISAVLLIGFVFTNYKVSAQVEIPEKLVITTLNETIGKAHYDGYSISVSKIISDIGVGYCLEINDDYPKGETFTHKGYSNSLVENILYNGYPNKTPEELGVATEDDAYFATQLALWSAIEGYNVADITAYNENVTNAIRNIFNNSQTGSVEEDNYKFVEYTSEPHVQDIVFLLKDEGIVNESNYRMRNSESIINNQEINNQELKNKEINNQGIATDKIEATIDTIPKTGDMSSAIFVTTSMVSLSILTFLNKLNKK